MVSGNSCPAIHARKWLVLVFCGFLLFWPGCASRRATQEDAAVPSLTGEESGAAGEEFAGDDVDEAGADVGAADDAEAAPDSGPVPYSLADAGLILTLPGDLAVVTPAELTNRSVLETAGLQTAGLRQFMQENQVLLYSLDQNLTQEILLVARQDGSRDYFLLSDDELMAVASSREMSRTLARLGTNSSVYSFFRSGNAAWIIIDIQQTLGSRTVYASEYFTVQNGRAIALTLQNSGSPLSAEQYAFLKSIVESIAFIP